MINESKAIKLTAFIGGVSFLVLSTALSLFVKRIDEFPSLQYNISGTIITIISVISIFSLPVKIETPIFKRVAFWLCFAFILFYPGQFLMNGFFAYIEKHKPAMLASLPKIFYFGLNYLLYIIISIGFLCLVQRKKYSIQ